MARTAHETAPRQGLTPQAAGFETWPGPARATRGDAALRRGIARWRGATARLVVMLNAHHAGPAVAGELHAVARQCERLAADVHQAADQARNAPGRAVR